MNYDKFIIESVSYATKNKPKISNDNLCPDNFLI